MATTSLPRKQEAPAAPMTVGKVALGVFLGNLLFAATLGAIYGLLYLYSAAITLGPSPVGPP